MSAFTKFLLWWAAGVSVLIILALIAIPAQARIHECQHPSVSSEFDRDLKKAARRHLPSDYNWCLLKALCHVESRLDPNAKSPVGAGGLCQLMELTAREYHITSGERFDAGRNSAGAARHLARLHAFWITNRTAECRWELMAASYNAGQGNVLRAQTASGGRRCWDLIGPYMHQITGDHSVETLAYVLRVWATYRLLMGYGL